MSPMPSNNAPIIIGGCFRSGTTLLRHLLDEHSRIHCAPEVKFFRDFFGDFARDDLAGLRFFRTLRTIGLPEGELLEVFGQAFVEVHERAAQRVGKRRWADKNPENVLYFDHWHTLLGGAGRFVHVVRHPLDTLASMVEARFDKTVPTDFDGKIATYRTFVRRGLEFSKRYPALTATVRYEDLVLNTQDALERLLRQLGETFEPSAIKRFDPRKRQPGLEDPKIGRTRSIHAASVGRWSRDLDAEQVMHARTKLAALAEELGYTMSDPSPADAPAETYSGH